MYVYGYIHVCRSVCQSVCMYLCFCVGMVIGHLCLKLVTARFDVFRWNGTHLKKLAVQRKAETVYNGRAGHRPLTIACQEGASAILGALWFCWAFLG